MPHVTHLAALPPRRRAIGRRLGWCGLAAVVLLSGCAAFHPVRGVPAAYLPANYLGPTRDDKRSIDPSLLVRSAPDQHRVGAGDVLSIYIPFILGQQSLQLDTNVGLSPPINMPHTPGDPPTVGYPFTVRDDDTLSLPQIPPLNVKGMSLHEVEVAIRNAYAASGKMPGGEEALVLVSLFRPRVYRVLVVRQEVSSGLTVGSGPGSVNIGATGKGTAREVILRAYENDVLHALSRAEGGADGLPGLSAENAVYIIRRPRVGPVAAAPPFAPPGGRSPAMDALPPVPQLDPYAAPLGSVHDGHSGIQLTNYEMNGPAPALPPGPQSMFGAGHSYDALAVPAVSPGGVAAPTYGGPEMQWSAMLANFDPTIDNPNVIRIPIRLGPGEVPQICESDITLLDGDIVFIDSRETEVFYTGGLLGGGQYTLPRDYDLRVLEALSIAESRTAGGGNNLNRAMGGVSALNHDVANSASRLVILRNLPTGRRISIEVNLIKAMRYQEENIVIQPGDMLILEYTLPEAVCSFTQRFLLEGAMIGIAASFFTGGSN